MNEPAIEDLFRAFRSKHSPQALAGVFDRTATELGRIASYLACGDARLAEDLLQSTWLSAMTHAAGWDDTRPLLPWLLGVLGNHARSQRRAARRGGPNAAADTLGDLLASDDPVRATEDAELQRLLAQALAAMPSPFREAVALHVQHGLTAKEIGEALGRPAGTVRTQIVRGLDRLRELLPRGLALAGLGVLALGSDAIARVRTDVLARLPAAPPIPATAAWRWGIALAAVAAIGVAPLLLPATDAPSPVPVAGATTPPAVAVATDAGRGTVRELVAAAQDPAPAAPAAKPRRRITVHVRHDDEPVVQPGEFVGLLDGNEVRFLTTSSTGDVVFDDVEPGILHQVFVSGTEARDVLTPKKWPPPAEFDREVTLTVEHAPAVTVRVVDAGGATLFEESYDRAFDLARTPLRGDSGEWRLEASRSGGSLFGGEFEGNYEFQVYC
jgi:RNA polymerase sigma-70 factor (ECF subfamily)